MNGRRVIQVPETQRRSSLRLRVLAAMGSLLIVMSLGAPIPVLAVTDTVTGVVPDSGPTPGPAASYIKMTVDDAYPVSPTAGITMTIDVVNTAGNPYLGADTVNLTVATTTCYNNATLSPASVTIPPNPFTTATVSVLFGQPAGCTYVITGRLASNAAVTGSVTLTVMNPAPLITTRFARTVESGGVPVAAAEVAGSGSAVITPAAGSVTSGTFIVTAPAGIIFSAARLYPSAVGAYPSYGGGTYTISGPTPVTGSTALIPAWGPRMWCPSCR